ncbi:CdaR family protein [Sporosarcina sp. ITBMC105]
MTDKFMDSPWFLRFTALALAIVLFFSVKAEDDKTNKNAVGDMQDIINDVPVEVYYDNENLVVTGVPETVNMTIDGPANLVKTTKLLKDFTLKVDLRSLPNGRHKVKILTENVSEKLDVRLDPATVDVVIEEKITQSFKVDAELNERLLADDFYVANMEVEPSSVQVTGAKSVIESISFVKVSATGDPGINKSFEQKARVRVLDRELNKLNVTIEPADVVVKVDVEENNKEVPIVLRQRGTPADNITIDALKTETRTVRLYGPKSILDSIKEIRVDVDVSKVEESGSMELALKKPKGVSSLSESKITVNVEASVKPEEETTDVSIQPEEEDVTREFKGIPIIVNKLDEKFTSTFIKPESGVVDLTVTAKEEVLNELAITDFIITVDASETASEGQHIYPLNVQAPNQVAWELSIEEVTVEIKLA